MSTCYQIVLNIVLDCFFERGGLFFIASLLQFGYVGAGIILILAAQVLRHLDIFDVRLFIHCGKNGSYQIVPGARPAGADIKKTVNCRIVEKEQGHIEMPENLRNQYQYYTCADITKLKQAGYKKRTTNLEDAIKDYVRNYLIGSRFLGNK